MQGIDKSGAPRKSRKHGSADSGSEQVARPDRFAFTIDASTGEIIQIEGVDGSGARHELSEDEKLDLAKQNGRLRLEELLERAFEAGIACVLGGEDEPETREDAELRHILLQPLIEESPAARLMKREVLDRAIVETLIQHSVKSRSAGPQGGSKAPPDRGNSTPKAS